MTSKADSPEVPDDVSTSHDSFADLGHRPSINIQLSSSRSQPWSFPTSSSRSTPSIYGAAGPPALFSRRPINREHARSAPDLDSTNGIAASQSPSLFNTPGRSIFFQGAPTSSLSANTAQASMSSPPANSSLPLSALTGSASGGSGRKSNSQPVDSFLSPPQKAGMSRAEKDVDEPSSAFDEIRSSERRGDGTPATLARLFIADEATTSIDPRPMSYQRTPTGSKYTYMRSSSAETAPLPSHLYSRGLLCGRHSDIIIHAFGTKYALHRLLLDRAPFFSSALSEPWFESSSKDISLHPEEIDSNITQTAFELALKHIYGCQHSEQEDEEAIGLFATGCWLEMVDLIEISIMSILRQMCPAKLSSFIRLVTSNYYGNAGERILASAKAMLCREGWEMTLRYWDGIPGDIVREIVGGDGFYVPGEWERFILAKRIFDRRLKTRANEAGLVDVNGKVKQAPRASMNLLAVRFDAVYRQNSVAGIQGVSETADPWLALYTWPDVAALMVLLDEGIHYVHLSFEHLQKIREQRDVLGLPLLPERVVSNALWMSMELRQRIVNARDPEMELGLSERCEVAAAETLEKDIAIGGSRSMSSKAAGKQAQYELQEDQDDEMESGSWDGNGKPRKFWIPSLDATYPMGGNTEALIASHTARPFVNRHISRLSATLDPHDIQWASDFASLAQELPPTPDRSVATEPSPPVSYTLYPPFRFAAEFPNPRTLKEKKRVYSSTVWYAGSLWNVYVQKIETAKNTQLGVYLHRERHREGSEETIANMMRSNTVDERIGHLEREMLMRRSGGRNRHLQEEVRDSGEDEHSGSGGDHETTLVNGATTEAEARRQSTALRGLLRAHHITKASEIPATLTLSTLPDRAFSSGGMPDNDEMMDDLTQCSKKFKVSALPPYVDGRATIKTYFKIYTPSKGGRMLSVYESAPDRFNFSQSWGWKSSNMILDDGIGGFEEGSRSRDGKLRFMVVIGNV